MFLHSQLSYRNTLLKIKRRQIHGTLAASPPLHVPNASQTPNSLTPLIFKFPFGACTVSLMNCTLPSVRATFTPLV
jgi:hypothetical protein